MPDDSYRTVQLLWPSHICTSIIPRSGFLIGWNNAGTTICVATVCENLSITELSDYLKKCSASNKTGFSKPNHMQRVQPSVLGVLLNSDSNHRNYQKQGNEDFWLTVSLNDEMFPEIRSIYDKYEQSNKQNAVEIIFYDQPNPEYLQYLAHDPLVLDVSAKETTKKLAYASEVFDMNNLSEIDYGIIKNVKKVMAQARIMTGSSMKEEDYRMGNMQLALDQINSSFYLENSVNELLSEKRDVSRSQEMIYRAITGIAEKAKISALYIFTPLISLIQALRSFIIGPSLGLLFVVRFFIEIVLYILNLQFPKWMLNGVALKDLSAAALQVDLRLQQLCFWPRQYMLIRKRQWANTAATRAQYISFYNSMWLIANDIIIGIAVGSFIVHNCDEVSIVVHDTLKRYTVDPLQMMMDWLLRSPGGLKLNDELGRFLSELFSWLIRLWIVCMQNLRPTMPLIVKSIGMSGIFGVSMIISLSSDLLAFMTLHVYWFYMVAARIFNWQFTILYSLFNLFRGKKRNVLRNRIDSCDYDLDQLLLGTSLFTLLMFLFPTVLSYYLTFASGRVGIIFSQAIMETMLAFFNHFPLFAIMLRIKDPGRLPGGLKFDVCQPDIFKKQKRFMRYIHRQGSNIAQAWKKQAIPPQEIEVNNESIAPLITKPKRGHKPRQRSVHFHDTPSSEILRQNTAESKRLSNGILQKNLNCLQGSYLYVKNLPIPFGAIFFQYMLLWKRLSAHYFSTYVLTCLVYGEPIKPIPKLLYPMLPDNRPSLRDFWEILKSSFQDD